MRHVVGQLGSSAKAGSTAHAPRVVVAQVRCVTRRSALTPAPRHLFRDAAIPELRRLVLVTEVHAARALVLPLPALAQSSALMKDCAPLFTAKQFLARWRGAQMSVRQVRSKLAWPTALVALLHTCTCHTGHTGQTCTRSPVRFKETRPAAPHARELHGSSSRPARLAVPDSAPSTSPRALGRGQVAARLLKDAGLDDDWA